MITKPDIMKKIILFCLILTLNHAYGQRQKQNVIKALDEKAGYYADIASQIWEHSELGFLEEKSTALLQSELTKAGFKVDKGIAGMPTAFVASYGSGKPVIGILGEYDALPGMSQEAVPERKVRAGATSGHGCGHNLFGTGSMAAAIAAKDWLLSNNKTGTIRYYGTPAEEGGSAKVFMVKAGLFSDVDAVISWHAGDRNASNPTTMLATKSGVFRFYGVSAHAAGAPERGRSALDGVEAMNHMVNLMREHTTEATRIHYVITKGGDAPNVVPSFAEVEYIVRHRDREEVRSLWERVAKCAQGAALGTDTRMEEVVLGGTYDRLPNEVLAKVMHDNLKLVGGVEYTDDERAFAEKISKTLSKPSPLDFAGTIQPFEKSHVNASADTGDVSWAVPLGAMRTATWVPGTPAHSWQAVASGGMSIGHKGMMVAAKTMALSAIDLYNDSKLIENAKKEFEEKRGPDFKYEALLGDIEPPLDFRKGFYN